MEKQSPQLSAEEGGDNAGAGESSMFKAVQLWRTRTPFALGRSLPGLGLAAPPPPTPGSAICRCRSKRIAGSPSPSRSYPARVVHAAAFLRVAPLLLWGELKRYTPRKGRESELPRWQTQSALAEE